MYRIFCIAFLTVFIIVCKADSWTSKADFTGTGRFAPAYFVIGNKAYYGTGNDSYPVSHFVQDFWEYDPAADTWTQKADFGGSPRYTAIGFSIGTKGFVGTGKGSSLVSDMWQYDQAANTWLQKINFPGPSRNGAIALSVNNQIYAGFGYSNSGMLNDWYSYDESTDTWTALASCPGSGRANLGGFVVSNRIFIGTGMVNYANYTPANDMWEYEVATNTWIQKANFPGQPRYHTVAFSINNKGYMGNGYLLTGGSQITAYYDFFEYDAVSDLWNPKINMPGNYIYCGGYNINGKGYITCGIDNNLNLTQECWEYTPDSLTSMNENSTTQPGIFPNPASNYISIPIKKDGEVMICDLQGKCLFKEHILKIDKNIYNLDVSFLQTGIYFLMFETKQYKFYKL